jgi:O-antigen/teichoic acid export membrane protein
MLARASVGPAERLLNMLGEQRACAFVYGAAFAVNVAACLLLIPRFGAVGAACATAAAIVVESVLLFLVIRIRLGIHSFIWRWPSGAGPAAADVSLAAVRIVQTKVP